MQRVGIEHRTILPEYQLLRVYSCPVGQMSGGKYHMLILLDDERNSVAFLPTWIERLCSVLRVTKPMTPLHDQLHSSGAC